MPAPPRPLFQTYLTPDAARPSPKSKQPSKPFAHSKGKTKPNGSILSFFKKAEEKATALFVPGPSQEVDSATILPFQADAIDDERYNECGGSIKRRKRSRAELVEPGLDDLFTEHNEPLEPNDSPVPSADTRHKRRVGPFALDSDSEDEKETEARNGVAEDTSRCVNDTRHVPAVLANDTDKKSTEAQADGDPLEDGNGHEPEMDDWLDDDLAMDAYEEYGEVHDGGESHFDPQFPTDLACPICSCSLEGRSPEDASVHVNQCLDETSTELPGEGEVDPSTAEELPVPRIARPPKPPQASPFTLGRPSESNNGSAFSKIMSSHAENSAWVHAAAAETQSRGKPSYQRTCPFYKIMPGFSISVDAFRYGAVQGCEAYFLSHFHSDHYGGLTSSWSHGPIYCSKVTGNLVREQLKVNPKYIVDLEFEKRTPIPNTAGAFVTMIPANHCPGSSLFLFEKAVARLGVNRTQRILHCGDFRAAREQLEHPLLRPEVRDLDTGSVRKQSIDVCYLDTTYLNPRYAFPCQSDVISACTELCENLDKGDRNALNDRSGQQMAAFIKRAAPEPGDAKPTGDDQLRGRLLVIVGTYSIGKERLCLAIARALGSKIFAPAPKRRICGCLEDPELSSLLTDDPRAAQVHMTSMFEIRSDTVADYMASYSDRFTRAVAFRPTGWTYRPPGSRATAAPTVPNVLFGDSWNTSYSVKDMVPQRGSTDKVSCFGVPYSEHSSFRELTVFCCALKLERIIPTVNVGNPKTRAQMKAWLDKCAAFSQRNPDSFQRVAELLRRNEASNR